MMMQRTPAHTDAKVVRTILRWYARHGRHLPWRGITDPYRILIAEIMLHQTQVNRVLLLYPVFLRRFPTLSSLARAPQSAVVIAWRGLGYNNRAVRLHKLAGMLVRDSEGALPEQINELEQLPGIGKYSAHALAVSVHRRDLPVVDVNIKRVLSRLFWRMPTTADLRPEKEICQRAEALVPRGRGYQWMQAVMDLGATVCTARTPACPGCPVEQLCASVRTMVRVRPPRITKESLMAGEPNRIYRGRIIETLRGSRGRNGIPAVKLGEAIYPRFSHRHESWLRRLLAGLEKDGLIRTNNPPSFRHCVVRLV
jgi:A/G-specific adenine glycosylase